MLPNSVSKAYNFPQGRKLNEQCVAIIELGGGFNPQDVFDYCDKNKVLRPELYVEVIEGAKNIEVGPRGADGEVCLDIDVIAMTAPGVKILVIFVPNTDCGIADGILAALKHPLKPCAISLSWGSPIQQWSLASRNYTDAAIAKALLAGVPTLVATGDAGSSDGTLHATTDFPASSPSAIACGGTRLTLTKTGKVKSEKAWSLADGNGSTGGGVCYVYSRPDYQKGIKLPGISEGRLIPDISGNADPVSGYDINVDGVSDCEGGTSAVAPLLTALVAILVSRMGKLVSNWHDVLYSTPGVCRDVVGGSNGAYQCTPGFDLCTGLGVPDGELLLAAMAKANGLTVLPPAIATPIATMPHIALGWKTRLVEAGKDVLGIKPKRFARKHIRHVWQRGY